MGARTALITGATRGIGKGLFERLAVQGVNVATIYAKDTAAAADFEKQARLYGIQYLIEQFDISESHKLAAYTDRVVNKLGRIDYLINNVGIDDSSLLFDISIDEWTRVQNILLNAPVYLSKLVLPIMRRQRFGRVINIGASSKDYENGAAGIGAFGIHKAALKVFTKTLALEELQHGITVNMVAPGSTMGAGVNTEENRIPIADIPLGRRVTVEEVTEAIMYFLSERSGSVTGQFIGVNGGLST